MGKKKIKGKKVWWKLSELFVVPNSREDDESSIYSLSGTGYNAKNLSRKK